MNEETLQEKLSQAKARLKAAQKSGLDDYIRGVKCDMIKKEIELLEKQIKKLKR